MKRRMFFGRSLPVFSNYEEFEKWNRRQRKGAFYSFGILSTLIAVIFQTLYTLTFGWNGMLDFLTSVISRILFFVAFTFVHVSIFAPNRCSYEVYKINETLKTMAVIVKNQFSMEIAIVENLHFSEIQHTNGICEVFIDDEWVEIFPINNTIIGQIAKIRFKSNSDIGRLISCWYVILAFTAALVSQLFIGDIIALFVLVFVASVASTFLENRAEYFFNSPHDFLFDTAEDTYWINKSDKVIHGRMRYRYFAFKLFSKTQVDGSLNFVDSVEIEDGFAKINFAGQELEISIED